MLGPLSRGALITLLLLVSLPVLAMVVPSVATTPPAQTIELLDAQGATLTVLEVSGKPEANTTVKTTVALRNPGPTPERAYFSLVLNDRNGMPYKAPPPEPSSAPLVSYTVSIVPITLTFPAPITAAQQPLVGYLVIESRMEQGKRPAGRGADTGITQRPLTITFVVPSALFGPLKWLPKEWTQGGAIGLWAIPLFVAALAVLIGLALWWRHEKAGNPQMTWPSLLWRAVSKPVTASPDWGVSSAGSPGVPNWIATIGVGGTIINLVITQKILPDALTTGMPQYIGITLFFGAMSALAPLTYSFTAPASAPSANAPQQGRAGIFVLTCFLALGGAYGQLLLSLRFFSELWSAGVVSDIGSDVILGVLGLAAVLIFFYGFRLIARLRFAGQAAYIRTLVVQWPNVMTAAPSDSRSSHARRMVQELKDMPGFVTHTVIAADQEMVVSISAWASETYANAGADFLKRCVSGAEGATIRVVPGDKVVHARVDAATGLVVMSSSESG